MQKYFTRRNVILAALSALVVAGGVWYESGSIAHAVTGLSVEKSETAVGEKGSDKIVTVEYTVQGGVTQDTWKHVILDSKTKFSDADNLTLFVSKGIGHDDPKAEIGKTYIVTGKVVDYKGKSEIVVTDAKQMTAKN